MSNLNESIEFQHTAARRRLEIIKPEYNGTLWFQHTAARRRLGTANQRKQAAMMFQHTAARRRLVVISVSGFRLKHSFNTQPPEGGWSHTRLAVVV